MLLTNWQLHSAEELFTFVKIRSDMKKILASLLVLAGLGFGLSAFAQEQSAQPYKAYCEIVSTMRNIFSDKTSVELDFGQAAHWLSTDRKLVDEDGKTITFNSVLDAVNYMSKRGWVFEQMYIVQSMSKGDSGTPAYHWIMSKDVTDESQIMEGLRTQGETK